jgi:hypothetical protein
MKKRGAVFRQSLYDFPCPVAIGKDVPSFGLHRFNKALRFVPPDDEGFTLRGDKRRLLYKGRRRSHRFTILDDCSFEYDVILEREPETNVVSLFMEGAENFDFFRQPDFVSEPFLKGSYAVYKKETLLGEGTGKLCHIHRPEIIDACGRRCWGDLAVDGNELRITIPEWWLAEAKYPVIVDPTVGTSTVGSQITGPDPNNSYYDRPWLDGEIALNKYVVPQNGGGVCTAYVYAYNDETYSEVLPGLFTDVNGKPYQKKSKNENWVYVSVWGSNPAGWRSNTFNLDGTITAGTNVWFGVFSGWFTTRFDYGGECYKFWMDWDTYEDYDGELTPYVHIQPWDTFCNIKWSWYFTYTAAENYVRKLTQTVKLTDTRKLKADYKKTLKLTAGVNSLLGRFESLYRKCVMTAHNSMNVGRFPAFFRSVAETIKVSFVIDNNRSLSRKCDDSVNVNSQASKIQTAFRKAQDIVSGIDTQSFSVLFVREVPDTATVSDYSRHYGAFVRWLAVNAGSEAETTHKTEYYRFHADTVQAAGTVFRGLLLFVRIVSKVFIRDYLLGRFLVAREELILKSAVSREITLDSKIS